MKKITVTLIRFVSLFFGTVQGAACRFHPSCSRYAAQAFDRFGYFRAFSLTLSRLSRCHPFCAGGDDPLPGIED
ncbi:MAG: membrane protein insertion efficiency factor YidD [Candidatus Omnitrophica bacterium]|nr:membrane protein insertion efficiency factor YidD [Candidatus Omnitrophota bacterium]